MAARDLTPLTDVRAVAALVAAGITGQGVRALAWRFSTWSTLVESPAAARVAVGGIGAGRLCTPTVPVIPTTGLGRFVAWGDASWPDGLDDPDIVLCELAGVLRIADVGIVGGRYPSPAGQVAARRIVAGLPGGVIATPTGIGTTAVMAAIRFGVRATVVLCGGSIGRGGTCSGGVQGRDIARHAVLDGGCAVLAFGLPPGDRAVAVANRIVATNARRIDVIDAGTQRAPTHLVLGDVLRNPRSTPVRYVETHTTRSEWAAPAGTRCVPA